MNSLQTEILIPAEIEEVWDFFTSPENLAKITPESMKFKIISHVPEKIHEGLYISYKVSPLFNISMDWVTEITQVKKLEFFVDEQRKGPYKIWRHEHYFTKVPEGVVMRDIVQYNVGKSILGLLAEKLFVTRKVEYIFNYRANKIKKIFESKNSIYKRT